MEKMTISKMYDNIIAKAEGVLSKDELDFLAKRKELVEKKNATRKPTKAQEENEGIKSNILAFMVEGTKYTVTEIMKGVGLESNQKTSALVRQLKDSGAVIRVEEKGKALFYKA